MYACPPPALIKLSFVEIHYFIPDTMNLKNTTLGLLGAVVIGISPAWAGTQAKVDFSTVKKHPAMTERHEASTVVPAKKAYAWATRERSGIPKGIVSFSLNNPEELTSVYPMANSAYAGCFADGKYYFDRYRTVDDSWEHIAFSSVDLSTGKVTDIKSWSDEYFVINDMAYDYTSNTIFAMGRTFYMDDFLSGFNFEYSTLMAISPTTGAWREVKQFIDWGNGTLTNPTYYNLACDLNGTLYSVNQNGELVTFDRDEDFAEKVIGRTGVNPARTTQSMEFDHTTGTLYWAVDYSSQSSELAVVDTASGLATTVGHTGSDAHLVGLYIPFDVPSEAAPGAVSEFHATPDAAGGLAISLKWKNPLKSFGGVNLASISSVKVLRDGQEVASLVPAAPGAEMTYSDNVPSDGLYSYAIQAVNAAGKGLASGVTRWVGKDVPKAVSNLGVGRTDQGHAVLEWTEPTEGAHGGVIDHASLGYKIMRFPDGAIVASDARGASFTDATVSATGNYYYTVESHTAQGVGKAASTVEIALGAAIDKFPWSTQFINRSEFDLWTVVDCSGGSTWQWKSRSAGGYEAQAMYQYDHDNKGDDYLISPDLYLRKGAKYVVKFAYAGANAYHTETLELTFGQGKTAEAQSTVLKDFTMKDGTFRTYETELPAVGADGYYNFAFHATSDAGQYNIYVTDISVRMTVAPPEGPGEEYDLKAPANLTAEVNKASGAVTLRWNESAGQTEPLSDNIVEDFESIDKWKINPEGQYGWSYIDGDGGIPYVDDYYDKPYPTDGTPLAAMVMAPNELHEYVYTPNPPHSGEQFLLFKSNYSAGDGSRPAPAPEDWFISPRLNFGQDFIFRFWCKADPDYEGFGDPWNTEYFQVGYSTSDDVPECFVWMTDQPESVTTTFDEWKKKEYAIPAEACYVCIRYCTPSCGFWFMVDDVFIGVESGAAASSAVKAPSAATFQAFDIYIDDQKVASTVETSHTHIGLAAGTHVAKVVARYAQGESEAAVASFTIGSGSAELIGTEQEGKAELYDLQGRKVTSPAPGLYLRRVGGVSTKVVIR